MIFFKKLVIFFPLQIIILNSNLQINNLTFQWILNNHGHSRNSIETTDELASSKYYSMALPFRDRKQRLQDTIQRTGRKKQIIDELIRNSDRKHSF